MVGILPFSLQTGITIDIFFGIMCKQSFKRFFYECLQNNQLAVKQGTRKYEDWK
jgi:hypothetical protein